jgi:hypothetical protein
MMLPELVRAVVRDFLAAVDAETPGLIEGLYLVGSIAQGDFRPHRSDIDFVAVTARRLRADELVMLQHVHTDLQQRWRRLFFDGIYVTWDDLAADPQDAGPCPAVHEGHLEPEGSGDLVAWHTLAHHGLCCRGPGVGEFPVWVDPAVLAAWVDANLETYWRRVLGPGSRRLRPYGFILTEWGCEWCVLGVSRIHYTLTTGAITTKDGAGLHALATFPTRWQRVVEEALRIRRGGRGRSAYWSPLTRRRDVLAFCDMAIADAHRLYRERWTT